LGQTDARLSLTDTKYGLTDGKVGRNNTSNLKIK